MRVLLVSALALCLAAPALAGEDTPAPGSGALPQPQAQPRTGRDRARDMKTLLQELRDLDASQDKDGDHVVGEHLC